MRLGQGTAHKLQVIVSAAGALRFRAGKVVASNASPPVVDGTNTAPVLLASITGTGTVDLVSGVASSNTLIEEFTLTNDSATVVAAVQFQVTDGTTPVPGPKFTLLPGETVSYAFGNWLHVDANGGVYGAGSQVQAAGVMMAPHFATANLTSTKTITSTNSFALYVGRLTKAVASVQVRARVTTAVATITWAEVAIAKGSVNPGGNPTLTVVGYADVSASYNSTGQKTTTVNVSAGQTLNPGDDLWLIVGNQATTAAALRAQSIADDLQAGLQASAVARPSLIVGTPTAFTIEGATTLAAWLAAIV